MITKIIEYGAEVYFIGCNTGKCFEPRSFYDSIYHRYNINDEDKIIKSRQERKVYDDTEFIKITDNIVWFQRKTAVGLKL